MQLKWGPPMISRFHFSVDWRGNLRRTFILLGILILVMSLAFESSATAPPWEAKDWTQWTPKECISILSDSPWTVTFLAYSHGADGQESMSPATVRHTKRHRKIGQRQYYEHHNFGVIDAVGRIPYPWEVFAYWS